MTRFANLDQQINLTAWDYPRYGYTISFGRRLRAAGVSFEDRQDLLGHKSGRITTHYSAAELHNLIEAANRVSNENSRKSPALTILNRKTA